MKLNIKVQIARLILKIEINNWYIIRDETKKENSMKINKN